MVVDSMVVDVVDVVVSMDVSLVEATAVAAVSSSLPQPASSATTARVPIKPMEGTDLWRITRILPDGTGRSR